MEKIVECVPNFCEGQNRKTIEAIREAIISVAGIDLKCVDSGYSANRSVYTFLGEKDKVFEAAYRSVKTAVSHIDMRVHRGAHPRFGAVDVFPFVALKNIDKEELIPEVEAFASRMAIDFNIPTYLYELSAKRPHTKNLADIRKGEYEGLEGKMELPEWTPDFYPRFNPKTGGMAIGVRHLLVAFNVNLETGDLALARRIASEIRQSGRWKRDNTGNRIQVSGICSGVKAIGWYIKDFEKVQVSMNIFDLAKTPVHIAYETCKQIAQKYGTGVTGSELIGCIPRKCLLDAAAYYALDKNDRSEKEKIALAVESMNMEEVKPFHETHNIIDVEF